MVRWKIRREARGERDGGKKDRSTCVLSLAAPLVEGRDVHWKRKKVLDEMMEVMMAVAMLRSEPVGTNELEGEEATQMMVAAIAIDLARAR